MLGIAFIIGTLCGWQYSGSAQAKHAFLLSLAVGVIGFLIKFTLHRRQWAKYVFLHSHVNPLTNVDSRVPLILSFGATSGYSVKQSSRQAVNPSNCHYTNSLNTLLIMLYCTPPKFIQSLILALIYGPFSQLLSSSTVTLPLR